MLIFGDCTHAQTWKILILRMMILGDCVQEQTWKILILHRPWKILTLRTVHRLGPLVEPALGLLGAEIRRVVGGGMAWHEQTWKILIWRMLILGDCGHAQTWKILIWRMLILKSCAYA